MCKGDQAAVGVRERDCKVKKELGKKRPLSLARAKIPLFPWLKGEGTAGTLVLSLSSVPATRQSSKDEGVKWS